MLKSFTKTGLIFAVVIAVDGLKSQTLPANKVVVAVCDNEDFEAGPAGIITSSNAVSGWSVFKLLYSSNFTDNCSALSSTNVTRTNPVSSELFTASIIDPIIGSTYPIYSVFGSGASNGGSAFNPAIPDMRGNNFIRVNNTSTLVNQFHSIEKTFTVTASNSLFRFAYLPVIEAGFSSCCSMPSVKINFYNETLSNSQLNCPSYSITVPHQFCQVVNTPSLMTSTTNTNMSYHPWKIAAVDLSPYIGSVIAFKLGAFYCANSGCPKTAYAYLDAQCGPMEIFVNNVSFPAHTNSVTFSGCGVTSATVVAPPDFSTYQWNGPGGFTSTLSTITTTATGVYTLNISPAGTCTTIVKYVNIGLFPVPNLSITSTNTLLCNGKSATITASGASSYTWNVTSNSPTLNVSPSSTFTYVVNGRNVNGCLGTASLTQSVVSCVGVKEVNNQSNQVAVFPNPARGEFVVRLEKPDSNAMIHLENSTGQRVLTQSLPDSENLIRTGALKAGLYSLVVIDNEQRLYSGKLAIE